MLRLCSEYQSIVDVRDFGAIGDGKNDDTDAVKAAVSFVLSSIITSQSGGDRLSRKTLYFPAGTYLITESEALLPSSHESKACGYRLIGDGIGQTTIWFKPTAGSRVLMSNNNAFLASDVRDIAFKSDSNLNTFMLAYSNPPGGAVQRWSFNRVEWSGAWGKGFELYGTNNNSEYIWDDCGVTGEMGKFLYTPPSTSSDQHLNFWFNTMKFWPTATAPVENCFIEMNQGGSISIVNSDFSGIQSGTMFKLLGVTHAFGVCHFTCIATRFELKSNDAKALYSEWPQGVILFNGCDFSSQRPAYSTSTECFTINDLNVPGASLIFDGCSLLGSFRFINAIDCFRNKKHTVFRGCNFQQFDLFTAFLFTSAGNQAGSRSILVEECRGGGSPTSGVTPWVTTTAYSIGTIRKNGSNVYEATVAGVSGATAPTGKGSALVDGTVTWKWVRSEPSSYATDGVVGAFARVNPIGITRRAVSFRNAASQLPAQGNAVNVILPPGAVIVKAYIQAPSGGVTSGAAAAYSIRTEEDTPTVFATGTSSPASAGFLYEWSGFFSVGSDMKKRSILLTSGAGVDQYNGDGIAALEYLA